MGSRPAPLCSERLLAGWIGLLPVLLLAVSASAAPDSSLDQPVVFCSLPADKAPPTGLAGGMLPSDYGEGASLVVRRPDGNMSTLASEFASACDPDVSFDGERILFAGRIEAGDPWNIFEMSADGAGIRQITHERLDARRPIYLSTFYTITSSEPWYTILFVRRDGVLNEAGTAPGTSLYTVRLDGTELRRITFHPGNDRTPFLMQDGYLLFSGWRTLSDPRFPEGRIGLYGVQTDGIDYSFYGGLQGARIQHMPTRTSDGLVVFVEAERMDWSGAGRLAALRAQRPHHSYQPLTSAGEGQFHSPSPLRDGSLLVSHRLESGDDTFGLKRFFPDSGRLENVLELPGHHILHARLLAPRPEPDGRSSTVRPESPTGKLYCLDVYESDSQVASLEKGTVERVRVIEGLPTRGETSADEGSSPVARRLLGEAPVESDGSFHIDLPADLPVELQLLDSEGQALASCDWIWVKHREYRGCIGCHEDPELTPDNRFVEAVARPANQLTLPPGKRRSVTFRSHVQPILQARCGACHEEPDGDLPFGSLDGEEGARKAYQALVAAPRTVEPDQARLVEPGQARASRLIWLLSGRDTSTAPGQQTGATSGLAVEHADRLSDEERRVFVEWIDLGAQWDLPSESTAGIQGELVP